MNLTSFNQTSGFKRTICMMLLVAIGCVTSSAFAQTSSSYEPIRHNRMRGDMPPGVAADMARMADSSLDHYLQPVQIVAPKTSMVEVAMKSGFTVTNSNKTSLGMFIGPVYRLKLNNIPTHQGKELYPSIELLDRLYPPQGMENDFPIQVIITQDDIDQAIDGNLVTKVIYLEDPRNAIPQKHLQDQQPYFDVGQREDPLRAATKLGRPMAILRIGSRIPTAQDQAGFNFHAPEPKFLPPPSQTWMNPKWQEPAELGPAKASQGAQRVPTTPQRVANLPSSNRFAAPSIMAPQSTTGPVQMKLNDPSGVSNSTQPNTQRR